MLWGAWDREPGAILSELIGTADSLFGNNRGLSLVLGRDFSGGGADRRREAAEAGFAAFPDLKLIASTARHTLTADHHRIAARADLRDGSHQTDEVDRSEEHTSELQSLMRISYAVFCLKKKNKQKIKSTHR